MHATLMHSVKADRQHMRRQSTVNMPYNDGTHYDIPALACFPNTDYATQCGDDLTLHRLLADCGLSSGRNASILFFLRYDRSDASLATICNSRNSV